MFMTYSYGRVEEVNNVNSHSIIWAWHHKMESGTRGLKFLTRSLHNVSFFFNFESTKSLKSHGIKVQSNTYLMQLTPWITQGAKMHRYVPHLFCDAISLYGGCEFFRKAVRTHAAWPLKAGFWYSPIFNPFEIETDLFFLCLFSIRMYKQPITLLYIK